MKLDKIRNSLLGRGLFTKMLVSFAFFCYFTCLRKTIIVNNTVCHHHCYQNQAGELRDRQDHWRPSSSMHNHSWPEWGCAGQDWVEHCLSRPHVEAAVPKSNQGGSSRDQLVEESPPWPSSIWLGHPGRWEANI